MGLAHNVHNHPNAGDIDAILSQYIPPYVLAFLSEEGMKIVPLPDGVTYARAGAAIRRTCASVDTWPVPPAGLFVVEERTVYLRSLSSLTVIHELGHALDRRSAEHSRTPRNFVTPYAASGLDEFFAESWRAYLGANDPNSPWPTVTRARLAASAPTMIAVFEGIHVDLERRLARQVPLTPEHVRGRDAVAERVDRDAPRRGRGRGR